MAISGKSAAKRVYPLQVHIIHSMMHMVASRIRYEKWMNDRELVEANPMIFDRIKQAMERSYMLTYNKSYSWLASQLFIDEMRDL